MNLEELKKHLDWHIRLTDFAPVEDGATVQLFTSMEHHDEERMIKSHVRALKKTLKLLNFEFKQVEFLGEADFFVNEYKISF